MSSALPSLFGEAPFPGRLPGLCGAGPTLQGCFLFILSFLFHSMVARGRLFAIRLRSFLWISFLIFYCYFDSGILGSASREMGRMDVVSFRGRKTCDRIGCSEALSIFGGCLIIFFSMN